MRMPKRFLGYTIEHTSLAEKSGILDFTLYFMQSFILYIERPKAFAEGGVRTGLVTPSYSARPAKSEEKNSKE